MKKKAILFSLFFTCICLAGGCGLTADTESMEGTNHTGDMAGNSTENTETTVLDKGGANGTDNVSIMDYLDETATDPADIPDSTAASEQSDLDHDAGNLTDDLGNAIQDIGDTVEDGIDALTSPNPAGNINNTTSYGNLTGNTTATDNHLGNSTGSATSSTNTGVVPGGNGR